MDSSVRETLNREKRELTDVKPQMDLTAIYRTHPNTKDYTFFSALHGTFSKLNTYFVTKQTLTDTKEKNGITLCILLDHHGLRLGFNSNANFRKFTTHEN